MNNQKRGLQGIANRVFGGIRSTMLAIIKLLNLTSKIPNLKEEIDFLRQR